MKDASSPNMPNMSSQIRETVMNVQAQHGNIRSDEGK